jgi:hypothetical protein
VHVQTLISVSFSSLKLEVIFCRLGNVQKMATARRDSQRSEMRGQEGRCPTKVEDALPKMQDAQDKPVVLLMWL